MTAVMQEDKKACFDAGMDDFVGKPIEPEELIGALRNAIGTAASPTPVTSVAHVVPPSDLDEALERLRLVVREGYRQRDNAHGGRQRPLSALDTGFASRADSCGAVEHPAPDRLAGLGPQGQGRMCQPGALPDGFVVRGSGNCYEAAAGTAFAEAISLLGNYLRAFSAQMVQTVLVAPRISDGARTGEPRGRGLGRSRDPALTNFRHCSRSNACRL